LTAWITGSNLTVNTDVHLMFVVYCVCYGEHITYSEGSYQEREKERERGRGVRVRACVHACV